MTLIEKLIKELNSFAWSDTCDKENVDLIMNDALRTEIELSNKHIHTKEDVIEAFSQGISAEINFDKEYHGEYFENYYNKTFKKNKQL